MTFEKTYQIQDDNKIVIELPDSFKNKKKVRVIIEDIDVSRKEKVELLAKALKDPLFLVDINEIADDFQYPDAEL